MATPEGGSRRGTPLIEGEEGSTSGARLAEGDVLARLARARELGVRSTKARVRIPTAPVSAVRARTVGVSSSSAQRGGEDRVGVPCRERDAAAARPSRTSAGGARNARSLTAYSVLERLAAEPTCRHPPRRELDTAWLNTAWPGATPPQVDLERARNPWCIRVVFIVRPPSNSARSTRAGHYIEGLGAQGQVTSCYDRAKMRWRSPSARPDRDRDGV